MAREREVAEMLWREELTARPDFLKLLDQALDSGGLELTLPMNRSGLPDVVDPRAFEAVLTEVILDDPRVRRRNGLHPTIRVEVKDDE